jgi:hypothetical protein
MPRTAFDPAKHGFHFANGFVNNVADLGPLGKITTRGRCGGMAYAALDYYFANLPVPLSSGLPADGTPLADYIYKRLMDSFLFNGAHFVDWTTAPDHHTWFRAGVTHWTKFEEFPKIKQLVDGGTPVALGLVSANNLGNIGENHQVVAIGYDGDPNGSMTVYVYDNNHPDQVIRIDSDPSNPHFNESTGEIWRGFFVEGYNTGRPDYLQEGTLLQEAGDPRVYVVYGGAKFWIPSPDQFNALGYQWTHIRHFPAGSMAYIADIPGEGTLLRELSKPEIYVVQQGKRHWIQSPQDFAAHGFNPILVRIIPDGSIAQVPDGGPLPVIGAPAPAKPQPKTPAGVVREPLGVRKNRP